MARSLLVLCNFSLLLLFSYATEFEARELKGALHTLMLRKHENCVSQKDALLLVFVIYLTKTLQTQSRRMVLQFCRKQVGAGF